MPTSEYWRKQQQRYRQRKQLERQIAEGKGAQYLVDLGALQRDIAGFRQEYKTKVRSDLSMAVPQDIDSNEESLNDYLTSVDEKIELHENKLNEIDTKIAANTTLLNEIKATLEAQGKATLPTTPEKKEEKPATPSTPQVNVSEGAKWRFIRKNGRIVKRRVQ